MKARVGDELIVRGLHVGDADRRGVITEVHGEDGSPPYLVRWADGHESSFFPSSGTEVEHIPLPAGKGATTALWGYRGLARRGRPSALARQGGPDSGCRPGGSRARAREPEKDLRPLRSGKPVQQPAVIE